MRILTLLLFLAVLLAGCSNSGSSNSTTASGPRVVYTGGGLKQLKELTGHRIREVELWDAADMNARIGKLVGEEYPKMKEDWLIESPIMNEGDVLMAAGCEMNNCDKNQWIMVADVADDNINVYHIKDGSMKLYKEKGEIKIPSTLTGEFERMKGIQGVK